MRPSPFHRPALGRDADDHLTIFVSSNLLELPPYRRAIFGACQLEPFHLLTIERRPGDPAEINERSIRLIERAAIYLGIFSDLDGPRPTADDRARLEMECDRARQCGLPCLIFVGRDGHQEPLADAELEASRQWLSAGEARLDLEFFSGPYDLRKALGLALGRFRAPPRQENPPSPTSLAQAREDLGGPLKIFDSLVTQGRYDEAYELFKASLYERMCVRWSLCEEAAASLSRFFPDGLEAPARLSSRHHRLSALWTLAYCYQYSGRVAMAATLWQKILEAQSHPVLDLHSKVRALHNLSESRVDDPVAAERAARESLLLAQRVGGTELGTSLTRLGTLLSLRGSYLQAFSVFKQAAASTFEAGKEHDVDLYVEFSEHALRSGQISKALDLARHGHELSQVKNLQRPSVRIANLKSAISGARAELDAAIEHASAALNESRSLNFRSEEIRALLSLARWREKQENFDRAHEPLESLWPLVERGPYPMDRARGLNILARLERERGDDDAAAKAAQEAFRISSAGGSPYSNPRQLAQASETLNQLGLPAPSNSPSHSESPLPMIKIDKHTI